MPPLFVAAGAAFVVVRCVKCHAGVRFLRVHLLHSSVAPLGHRSNYGEASAALGCRRTPPLFSPAPARLRHCLVGPKPDPLVSETEARSHLSASLPHAPPTGPHVILSPLFLNPIGKLAYFGSFQIGPFPYLANPNRDMAILGISPFLLISFLGS